MNDTFEYQIPAFSDPEKKKVSIRFIPGLKSFMTFDERSNTLKMKPTKEGEHYLKLKLEDEDGETGYYHESHDITTM